MLLTLTGHSDVTSTQKNFLHEIQTGVGSPLTSPLTTFKNVVCGVDTFLGFSKLKTYSSVHIRFACRTSPCHRESVVSGCFRVWLSW